MLLSFRPPFVRPGIAQPNYTIKKKERVKSHLPLNHLNPPFPPRPSYEAACSKGLNPMTSPIQTLPPLPPLKAGEYDSRTASNQIRDASEKKLWREWDTNSFRGGSVWIGEVIGFNPLEQAAS